ncbi:hypothetical protein ON010_g6862 [Phytophthora cinnamomi]|nr:hypothetical protein ON010_g6862 [Phytophthora cinnamomi]
MREREMSSARDWKKRAVSLKLNLAAGQSAGAGRSHAQMHAPWRNCPPRWRRVKKGSRRESRPQRGACGQIMFVEIGLKVTLAILQKYAVLNATDSTLEQSSPRRARGISNRSGHEDTAQRCQNCSVLYLKPLRYRRAAAWRAACSIDRRHRLECDKELQAPRQRRPCIAPRCRTAGLEPERQARAAASQAMNPERYNGASEASELASAELAI